MATSDSSPRKIDGAQVFDRIWHAYRTLGATGEESCKATGLGYSDFRVLQALFHEGPLPVNVIGDKINLTTGSITTAIHRMEAKSFVTRKAHASDRRIRLVELTAKGKRLIERAHAQHLADMDRAVACLTSADRTALLALLQKITSDL